jgi:hypothetical protein
MVGIATSYEQHDQGIRNRQMQDSLFIASREAVRAVLPPILGEPGAFCPQVSRRGLELYSYVTLQHTCLHGVIKLMEPQRYIYYAFIKVLMELETHTHTHKCKKV